MLPLYSGLSGPHTYYIGTFGQLPRFVCVCTCADELVGGSSTLVISRKFSASF